LGRSCPPAVHRAWRTQRPTAGQHRGAAISPAIIVQGTSDGTSTDGNTAFGTVDSAPADNAFIQFVGAASTKLRCARRSRSGPSAWSATRLQMPFSGVASYAVDEDTGISIRYWRGPISAPAQHVHRWDMMYGAQVMDPFLGTRICGS
jgi:hypothetical protein